MFNEQLAVERSKSDDALSASTVKKKRKRIREASDKSDTVNSAKTETGAASVTVKVEPEFVAHDYGKANLMSLLQGTF